MKIRRPSYYKNFNCIGSKCTDNCCIGWEIDIDEKANEYYQSLQGEFGDRLRSSIECVDDNHFILNHERCPFLNKDNLCDIILNLGEDKLCNICTEHPRFYEWFDGLTEIGVGLCCEEAGRLLFENSEPITFETYELEQENDFEEYVVAQFSALIEARETAFSIMQNREIPIEKRIGLILAFATDLQNCIDDENIDTLHDIIEQYNTPDILRKLLDDFLPFSNGKDKLGLMKAMFEIYQTLEPFDQNWTELIIDVKENLPNILDHKNEFLRCYQNKIYEYEHLMVYFIYRYFMKAVFDEDLLSKIKLAVMSYLMINTLDIFQWINNQYQFELFDRITVVKSYSKEIEYSQDNMNQLADESYANPIFDFENLLIMLF